MAATSAPEKTQRPAANPLGWLLLIPAVAVLVVQLIIPAVRTLRLSFGTVTILQGSSAEAGFTTENYHQLGMLFGSLIVGLGLGCLLLVGGLIIGPLIGKLAAHGPDKLRTVVMIILAVVLISYAPLGFALASDTGTRPFLGLHLPPPLQLMLHAILIGYLPIVTVACALAHLATGRVGISVIIGVVTLLACLAWGLQAFDVAMLTPVQHPNLGGTVLAGLSELRTGPAAAASVLTLVVLFAFGLAAGLVVIIGRVGFRVDEAAGQPGNESSGNPTRGLGLGVTALVLAVLGGLLVLIVGREWFIGLFRVGQLPPGVSAATAVRAWVNSWLSAGIGTVLQLVVAGLAGFGIGYLRPIGRHSRWLLLFFAPWLFVGPTPLLIARFIAQTDAGAINRWWDLVPPIWLAAPAIFLFSWLFSAIRDRRATGTVVGGFLLAAVVLVLTTTQSLQTGFGSVTEPRLYTAALLVYARTIEEFASAPGQTGGWLLMPPPLLAVLAAAAIVAVLLLRRLRIETGPEH